jgi:hypothetical protein
MTEPVATAAWLVPIAGAITTVGILTYQNRREIARIKDWAWGPERSSDEGHEGDVDSLSGQIDRIESKLDAEREQRLANHEHVEQEIKKNRILVHASVRGLLKAVNREVPEAEINIEDIEPEWITNELTDIDDFDYIDQHRRGRSSDD